MNFYRGLVIALSLTLTVTGFIGFCLAVYYDETIAAIVAASSTTIFAAIATTVACTPYNPD